MTWALKPGVCWEEGEARSAGGAEMKRALPGDNLKEKGEEDTRRMVLKKWKKKKIHRVFPTQKQKAEEIKAPRGNTSAHERRHRGTPVKNRVTKTVGNGGGGVPRRVTWKTCPKTARKIRGGWDSWQQRVSRILSRK